MQNLQKTDSAVHVSGFNDHNGIAIVEVNENGSVVEGELRPEALNPMGMAHGGFVYSLCDVAAGVMSSYNGTQGGVTLSGGVSFLHPSRGSKLRCEGKLIKNGRTIKVVETSVYDDNGLLTARGTFEIYTLRSE